MDYQEFQATNDEGSVLANLRVEAMRESLLAVGRFDPVRARERFLGSFEPENTVVLRKQGQLLGFYVLEWRSDHLWLAHLYIHPDFHSFGIGSSLLAKIKLQAKERNLPIRLGALRSSRSNEFYKNHGFAKTHEEEWDIYYEYAHS